MVGRGRGMIGHARYGTGYFPRDETRLKLWYQEVVDNLRKSPYELVVKIFRTTVAQKLVERGHFPNRSAVSRSLMSRTLSARPSGSVWDVGVEDDNDDDFR